MSSALSSLPQVGTPNSGAVISQSAFVHDLPGLLATNPGCWVAYAHGQRVQVASTQTELYKHCLQELGLNHDEFVVRLIVPDAGIDVESPPR
jgi:hypothetical protein